MTMKINLRITALAIIFTLFSACAFGRKIQYQGLSFFTVPKISNAIALAIQDQRPYIINGRKSLHWVGLQRSLYGIPYGVHTKSGLPLADDLGSILVSTMKQDNVNVTQVKIPISASPSEILSLLRASGASKFILIKLKEWKTDDYAGTTFHHDISFSVLNKDGNIEVTRSSSSVEKLGKNPKRKNLVAAISDIFGFMVNDPEVIASLNNSNVKTAFQGRKQNAGAITKPSVSNVEQNKSEISKSKCNVEQILKMKDMGMNNSQISAACGK
jgi:hypothetical protein